MIPKGLPLREDQIQRNQTLKVIGKAIMPTDEIMANPRSRSAVLRIAERWCNVRRFRTLSIA